MSESNEIVSEETETRHFKPETDVDRELNPMDQENLSNDGMEVQNDTHSIENSFAEPSTTISLSNQDQEEILSRDEDTISNIHVIGAKNMSK